MLEQILVEMLVDAVCTWFVHVVDRFCDIILRSQNMHSVYNIGQTYFIFIYEHMNIRCDRSCQLRSAPLIIKLNLIMGDDRPVIEILIVTVYNNTHPNFHKKVP